MSNPRHRTLQPAWALAVSMHHVRPGKRRALDMLFAAGGQPLPKELTMSQLRVAVSVMPCGGLFASKAAATAPAAATASRPVVVPAMPVAAPVKVRKPVLVRDSFTMPEVDFALIASLKKRAIAFQRPAKKSELLRAGLHALAALDDKGVKSVLDALLTVQTGRPKKH